MCLCKCMHKNIILISFPSEVKVVWYGADTKNVNHPIIPAYADLIFIPKLR